MDGRVVSERRRKFIQETWSILEEKERTAGKEERTLPSSLTPSSFLPQKKKRKLTPTLKVYQGRQVQKSVLKLLKDRRSLPVFENIPQIMEALSRSRILVISGETGSGKSTQIPQILLQFALEREEENFNVVCTQPRRISAVRLASRVGEEVGDSSNGRQNNWVGYQVKNDSSICQETCITYCTIGVLLRRMISDPLLEDVTHVIVDECHERSLDSDFLLLLLRRLSERRKELWIILMSATANARQFAGYFERGLQETVPCLTIPGRTFPVTGFFIEDIIYETDYVLPVDSEYRIRRSVVTKSLGSAKISGRSGNKQSVMLNWQQLEGDSDDDLNDPDLDPTASAILKMISKFDPRKINMDLIAHIIRFILTQNPANIGSGEKQGSVIVFLPGVGEIRKLKELLEIEFTVRNQCSLHILPLHSALTNQEQAMVFKPPPPGMLKVVLSTNIAETGVTIPDVVYVIDSVKAREINYNQKRGMTRLVDTWISKANVRQRMGRAGRVRPGLAFHLIPSEAHENLPDYQKPEALRLPLEEICLRIRTTLVHEKIPVGIIFDELIDPPPEKNVAKAVSLLQTIEAFNENQQITSLGRIVGQLPLDVRLAKMLVYGYFLGCLDPILTVCSILSASKGPFLFPVGSGEEARRAHLLFYQEGSDILSWVKAFDVWQQMWLDGKNQSTIRSFCTVRYLSYDALQIIHDSRYHLLQSLMDVGLVRSFPLKLSLFPRNLVKYPGYTNRNASARPMIEAAIAAGLYPNMIFTPQNSKRLCLASNSNTTIRLHSNSAVDYSSFKFSTSFYTYNSIQIKKGPGGKDVAVLFDLSTVNGIAYILLCAGKINFRPLQESVILDGSLRIRCFPKSASVLLILRARLRSLFERLLIDPASSSENDAKLIDMLILETLK